VVVGDLGVVEHFFALAQGLAPQGSKEGLIGGEAVEDGVALGRDVVGQKSGIDARVGGDLLLVEGLDDFEGSVGGETELLVAFDLQRGEVEQAGRRLASLFAGDVGDGEGLVFDGVNEQLSLGLGLEPEVNAVSR